jgi:hypothetical protein
MLSPLQFRKSGGETVNAVCFKKADFLAEMVQIVIPGLVSVLTGITRSLHCCLILGLQKALKA